MKHNLIDYDQYFFDCDGVILDSNNIKSDAFFKVASLFSPSQAHNFLIFHKTNGGISRFEKFKYFFSVMLEMKTFNHELEKSLSLFKTYTTEGLEKCNIVEGVDKFLESLPKTSQRFVVSGGLEEEVFHALKIKNLHSHFNGIYGSPKNKYEIMLNTRSQAQRAVFFGDSKLDYEVAHKFNCDFVFISGQTEFENYQSFFQDKQIKTMRHFA